MALFVTTVLSKATEFAKAESKGLEVVVTDAHAERAIRSFLKIAEENIKLVSDPEAPTRKQAEAEREILLTMLPKQTDRATLETAIKEYLETNDVSAVKSPIGPIMGYLNQKFGASLDKALASTVIRELLGA